MYRHCVCVILFVYGFSIVLSQVTDDPFECRMDQWRCKDGNCIPLANKCDGKEECSDGSDETFPVCRNNKCDLDQFRCAYGSCVNKTAPCNQAKDCADNSDEALFRCLPETDRILCLMVPQAHYHLALSCSSREFDCENGMPLYEIDRCDGKVDCSDGSDETTQRCTEHQCTGFRCAYGGCAHHHAMCNGVVDCADASDESDELCDRIPVTEKPRIIVTTTPSPPTANCTLPPHPDHGSYVVSGYPAAKPGDTYAYGYLNITCDPPYKVLGRNLISCYKGMWSAAVPQCVLFCKLPPHPSVDYNCLLEGSITHASRPCSIEEPAGTTVRPSCRTPNYYYPKFIPYMHCGDDGVWDTVAICEPECGRITPTGKQLVVNGTLAKRGELPWHAGIYRKNIAAHEQICGGSILTPKIIVSAAHCFWKSDEGLQPPSNYAVAVGKLHREWDSNEDTDAQKSDVTEVIVPVRFQGVTANFQDDIGLVVLTSAIQYQTFIRPVCIDFDREFNKRQLMKGNLGKVAGWGITDDGNPSPVLKVANLPVVPIPDCLTETPVAFRSFVTTDKICAGYSNGTAVCKGDSGGGLAFPVSERGIVRHYLRGLVSTAPQGDFSCNSFTLSTFTQIITHQYFIQRAYGRFY